MSLIRDRAQQRTRGAERGAALVEFSLIATLVVTLLLGTITFGLSLNRDISLNNSAREASRYGATLPVQGDLTAWLNAVADVAIEAASGDLGASAPGQQVCVAFVFPDGSDTHDRTVSLVESSGSRTVSPGTPCFGDSRPGSERRVQVQLGRDTDVSAAVFTTTVTLNAQSIVRFERS